MVRSDLALAIRYASCSKSCKLLRFMRTGLMSIRFACQTKWLMRSRTSLTVIPSALFMFGLGRFAVTKQRRARDARSVSV